MGKKVQVFENLAEAKKQGYVTESYLKKKGIKKPAEASAWAKKITKLNDGYGSLKLSFVGVYLYS